jgi:hypothetical protein
LQLELTIKSFQYDSWTAKFTGSTMAKQPVREDWKYFITFAWNVSNFS